MRKTALLFAGQGAQTVGMGKDLAERFPTAQRLFAEANQALGYDLATICFEGPEEELTKTEHAQPGIYLVSWVAYSLLREQCPGLQFQATAGLSLGEFTALSCGGALAFLDGLKLVRQRGRFMQEACEVTQGSMAAIIGLDEATAAQVCAKTGVALANLNCPGQIVISGEADAITKACAEASLVGAKRALPLKVAGAYHSPLMASAQVKLEAALRETTVQAPNCMVISNVTGQPHGTAEQVREMLVRQVTGSVRWEDSMRYLLSQGFNRFIELGPGTALGGFMKRIDRSAQLLNVADVKSLEQTIAALQAE